MNDQSQTDDQSQADDSSKQPDDQAQPTTEIVLPPEANDADLIEKEWVDRAKEIVDHTRDNPYEQQRALNLMKSEYMKKRYNRDLKSE